MYGRDRDLFEYSVPFYKLGGQSKLANNYGKYTR